MRVESTGACMGVDGHSGIKEYFDQLPYPQNAISYWFMLMQIRMIVMQVVFFSHVNVEALPTNMLCHVFLCTVLYLHTPYMRYVHI